MTAIAVKSSSRAYKVVVQVINCQGAGRRICKQRGFHSWFHHSQDSMRPDYPPGFDGSDL